MSISYSVKIKIDTRYTSEIVSNILQKCLDNGFEYFAWKNDVEADRPFSSYEATDFLLGPYDEDDGAPVLMANINGSWFFLRIYEIEKQKVIFSFFGFSPEWKQEFINGGQERIGIDFARYIRLMCKICDDYPIIGVETDSY